ncbi:YesK family protein [Senegalia massiliensis]|nr:YesK family protein [Senegalia massiliensis]
MQYMFTSKRKKVDKMDASILEVWFPLFFIGIIFTIGILAISFKVSRTFLYSISLILSLICIILFLFSITVIRRWEGLAIGFIAISSLIGTWIGTIIGMLIKK